MSNNIKCTETGCTEEALYFCIVEEGILACELHLPTPGQGREYFWEIDFK